MSPQFALSGDYSKEIFRSDGALIFTRPERAGADVYSRCYVAQRASVQDEPLALGRCLDSEVPIRPAARGTTKRVPSPIFAFGAEATNISAGRSLFGLAQVCVILFWVPVSTQHSSACVLALSGHLVYRLLSTSLGILFPCSVLAHPTLDPTSRCILLTTVSYLACAIPLNFFPLSIITLYASAHSVLICLCYRRARVPVS